MSQILGNRRPAGSVAEAIQLIDDVGNRCAKLLEITSAMPPALMAQLRDFLVRRHGPAFRDSLLATAKILVEIPAPLTESEKRQTRASPYKWDEVKRDQIYLKIMLPALGLFDGLRAPQANILTGLDIRSGKKATTAEAKAIKALPSRDTRLGRKLWAQLIVELTLSGKYWANAGEVGSGGWLYDKIAKSSLRSRRGKRAMIFKGRYGVKAATGYRGVSPREFIDLPAVKKVEVLDMSLRGQNEPLSAVKVVSVSARAEKIEHMAATPKELKRGLIEEIERRLASIPRK